MKRSQQQLRKSRRTSLDSKNRPKMLKKPEEVCRWYVLRIPSLVAVFTVLVKHLMIAVYMFSRCGKQWHIPVRVGQEEILTCLHWSLTTSEKRHFLRRWSVNHYMATLQTWCPDHWWLITEVSDELFDFMILTAQVTLMTTAG